MRNKNGISRGSKCGPVHRNRKRQERWLKREEGWTKRDEGWTLIEILIGITIVLILMTSIGVMVVGNVDRARQATARDHIGAFDLALDSYLFACGQYPTEEQGLRALVEKPILSPVPAGWSGPYLKVLKIPADPWGNPYEYKNPGPGGLPYGIRCFGADGIEGGEDKNRDIVSWEIDQ
ncbi:MAG TPA: type II secretion system major pseudopilin GspG [Spirochaetia bacterium]|nr:type II secretion system major pseudopilin GspG [Spirochaetia bacterium]